MFIYRVLSTACLMICLVKPAFADHPSISVGSQGAGPINTATAGTLPQNKVALDISSEYVSVDSFSDAALVSFASNHVHAHSVDWMLTTTLGVAYGLYDDLTLSVRLPYVYKENIRAGHHSHGGGPVNSVEDHGDVGGIGDASILGKYRFWQQGDIQAAVMLGAKLPAGRTDVRDDGEKLETEHQPGSGSWDGLFGFAAGTRVKNVSVDASALYTLATEGSQDTDLGDRLQYNLAASYRIGGEYHNVHAHYHKAFDLVLELNGEWADQIEEAGELDDDSGGNEIFVSPGFRYAPNEKWSGHVSVGIPVVSNLGDGHAKTDYKVTLGIARNF